jgi:hypothetical protein
MARTASIALWEARFLPWRLIYAKSCSLGACLNYAQARLCGQHASPQLGPGSKLCSGRGLDAHLTTTSRFKPRKGVASAVQDIYAAFSARMLVHLPM